MSNPNNPMKTELISKIDAAWAEMETFLSGLTDQQMTMLHDKQGWNVRDHVTHLTTWEESVALLFHGKPRIQTLGIEPSQYPTDNFDEINATIRNRFINLSGASALERFRRIHAMHMGSVQKLTDIDLPKTVSVFFARVPENDERSVLKLIQVDTYGHYLEHLPWMKAIVASGK